MKNKVWKPLPNEICPFFPPCRSRRTYSMKIRSTHFAAVIGCVALLVAMLFTPTPALPAQAPAATYEPKFPGDPARSDSEAAALAYMRVVLRAQHRFEKQYGHFATSLTELVHSGSFTKRMVDPNRGDYTVGFRSEE